jgi:hypothetical protein
LTTEVPEQQPGVAYLVPNEVLLRFPQRTDFLTPQSFRVLWLYQDAAPEPGLLLRTVILETPSSSALL